MHRTRHLKRRLRFERLESRWLLARAAQVEHEFREDDFAIAGTYTYRLHVPEEFDYIDEINNGTYTSREGHVEWSSPKDGEGFFEGTALGDGRDTVNFAGRRNCSEYGIEDIGSFEFTVDAQLSSMRIDQTETISTRYTYYRDLTGGHCEQPDPPWSRFFGGRSNLYIGTFDASDHRASIRYEESSPELTVNSPKAEVEWSVTSPTDLELNAVPFFVEPEVPEGWELIPQSGERPDQQEFVDVEHGGVEIVVAVHGKPVRTNDVMQLVGRVRLYWAFAETDVNGPEIPVVSDSDPVGVFWNSSQLRAVIDDFPERPEGATHIRITVDAPSGTDSLSSNSSKFLPIGEFEARNNASGPLGEDNVLDGRASSVMHLADSTDPAIKVFAYKTETPLGASVTLFDEDGGFFYDPTFAPLIQALAPGERINDGIDFLAIKDQTLIDAAVHVVTLEGVNDPPIAEFDESATTNYQNVSIAPAFLLGNDLDIDHGDQVEVHSVDTMSVLGVPVRLVWNDSFTKVQQIIYDTANSSALKYLNQGDEVIDQVNYEISDRHGGTAFGTWLITVTGEERRLGISEQSLQMTESDVPTNPITFFLDDPDGDPSDLQLSAVSTNAALVSSAGFQFDGSDGTRTLVVTPAPGATGRTRITVTAADNADHSASTTFSLIVGTESDRDLDGVSNEEEDASPNGGDMNQDFVPDSQQPHVTSLRTWNGNAYLNLATPADNPLEAVVAIESPAAAGSAGNAQLPVGMVHYEVLVANTGAPTIVTFRSDYSELPLNRYFQHDGGATAASWRYLMYNKADGARVYSDRIEFVARDDGRADHGPTDNTRLVGNAVLAHVEFPWRNIVREDIDNDGVVVPLDVLAVINRINEGGSRLLGKIPSDGDSLPIFMDPSGGNSLEPIDALIVINFLNQRALQSGEGEASATLATAALLAINLTFSTHLSDLDFDVQPALQARESSQAGHSIVCRNDLPVMAARPVAPRDTIELHNEYSATLSRLLTDQSFWEEIYILTE